MLLHLPSSHVAVFKQAGISFFKILYLDVSFCLVYNAVFNVTWANWSNIIPERLLLLHKMSLE